ncbi:MAG: hypothetical protein V1678_04760, partial [Candidatus Aenigmatarchaeota archaeon]
LESIGLDDVGSGFSIALSMAAVRSLSLNNPYRFFDKKANIFPYPLSNIIGGGAHSGYITEQELLVIPVNSKNAAEAVRTNISIWNEVGKKLRKCISGMNRECAWMCNMEDLKALDVLTDIAKSHGARIGIDFAANSFYDEKSNRYVYKSPVRWLAAGEQLDFVMDLIKTYNLAYVEDPFHENDFHNFANLTKKAKCIVTGDDLFVTNASRLSIGIKKKAGNAIIIKPNQAGTISRIMKAVNLAKKARYSTIVSHRSCETNDTFISDLALGIGSALIKVGAHGMDELKLNRLVDLWNDSEKPRMAKISHVI